MSQSRFAPSDDADLDQCPNCGYFGPEDGEIREKATAFRWQYCDCGWQSEMRGYRLIKQPWAIGYRLDPTLIPDVLLFQKLRGKFKVDPTAFSFLESLRQLVWKGKIYRLTANQTEIIRVLYRQYLDGRPDIHIVKLMSLTSIPSSSPRNSFKKRNHELWGTLIIHKKGSPQGTRRLDL